MIPTHPLLAEIDSSAILHNCRIFRSLIPTGCKLCAAVKCNAYGHGIHTVLPALEKARVEMLCVATIQEARELRISGWKLPVLLLGSELSLYPDSDKKELARWLVENRIRPTVTQISDLESLVQASALCGKPARVHLMFDSGMSRMGVSEKRLLELIHSIENNDAVEIEGLYTHLATADEHNKRFAEVQLSRFRTCIKLITEKGLKIPIVHAANSAALIDLPQSHFDMVRPGISLYGYPPGPEMHHQQNLKPAIRVVSFLTLVKEIPKGSCVGYGCTYKAPENMRIGLVPIGYGDGYNRHLSNCGEMTINGYSVPVIGRISMDQTIVNLNALKKHHITVGPGQKVVVIDKISQAPNSVESLAEKLGTLPHEILTVLGNRIVRMAYE